MPNLGTTRKNSRRRDAKILIEVLILITRQGDGNQRFPTDMPREGTINLLVYVKQLLEVSVVNETRPSPSLL